MSKMEMNTIRRVVAAMDRAAGETYATPKTRLAELSCEIEAMAISYDQAKCDTDGRGYMPSMDPVVRRDVELLVALAEELENIANE